MEEKFKTINKEIYISKSLLIKLGFNKRTLENYLSKNKKGKHDYYFSFKHIGKIWILLSSLPYKIIQKYNIPTSKVIINKIIEESYHQNKLKNDKEIVQSITFLLTYAWNNKDVWGRYKGYYHDYAFNEREINLYSKTHSLFTAIIELREGYKMKDIFEAYKNFKEAKFQTENINSFYNKINKVKKRSIDEILIHSNKLNGKPPYKLKPFVQKLIKKYYSCPARYSVQNIHVKVNNEIISRGLSQISYSTINRYIKLPEVKNLCDPIRMGVKYTSEYILPSLIRRKPESPCDVIQIDSTRINIPYFNRESNNVEYLYLCVGLDSFSSKILGFSFAESENTNLILRCYKNIFSDIKVFPYQFLIDNHTSYNSKIFKEFKYKLETFGVLHRASKARNPQDKGNVERWFNTFQSRYLNSLFGSLGNGITSRSVGGRVSHEIEQFYKKKENLRSKKELISDITKYINEYNSDHTIAKEKLSPNKIFKDKFNFKNYKPILKGNMAFLFFEQKYIKVKKSTIKFEINKYKYYYIIYNTQLANKINGTKVLVRYDPNDYSYIRVFDTRTDSYLGEIKRYFPVSMLPNKTEFNEISKHQLKIKQRINQHIEITSKSISEVDEELNFYPVITMDYKKDSKLDNKDKKLIEFSMNSLAKHYRINKIKKEPYNVLTARRKIKRRKINEIYISNE